MGPSGSGLLEWLEYWQKGGTKIEATGYPTIQTMIVGSEKNFISENRIKIFASVLGDRTEGTITLGDDDFFNDENIDAPAAPAAFVQGTNGTATPIATPGTQAQERMSEIYAHGYVEFQVHPEHVDSYPFDLNTHHGSVGGMWMAVEDYDDKQDMTRSASFWATCVSILFQPNIGHDWDPDGESIIGAIIGGSTPSVNNDVVLIWNESVHEIATAQMQNFQQWLGMYVAHEIGHLYIRTLHSSGLMATEPELVDSNITAGDLDLLRSEE